MSNLHARLGALRGETGAAPFPHDGNESPRGDLAGPGTPGRARGSDAYLARLIGGTVLEDGLVLVETVLPAGSRYGRMRTQSAPPVTLEFFAPPGTSALDPERTFAIDTETTGLAGGTGTVPFLVGTARFESHRLTIRQYVLTRFGTEARMLQAVARDLGDRPTILSFNGKSYDLPLLATRYRLSGLAPPLAGCVHLDLLHPLRRAFAGRWPDCRLTTAESRLLGVRRDRDVASSEIPAIWFRWLREGTGEHLALVAEHNRHDLISLALLPAALHHAIAVPGPTGADTTAAAREHLRRHDPTAARAHLTEQGTAREPAATRLLARLARRDGDHALARRLWEELGADGDVDALEHLAKHFEHVARDPIAALLYARRLVARSRDPRHAARIARLQRKLG